MLNLAATDILAGVAGTATAITYTLTGMELNAGVEAYKVLAQGQLPNSVGTLYTAPSSTQTFIKSLTLANATGIVVHPAVCRTSARSVSPGGLHSARPSLSAT
jgi:hypothetical protein